VQGYRYGAEAYQTVSQPITANVWTYFTFDAVAFDSGPFWNSTTNKDRLTIPAGMSGMYAVMAYTQAFWTTTQIGLWRGSQSGIFYRKQFISPLDAITWVGWLNATDYVKVGVLTSNTGYSTTIETAAASNSNSPNSPMMNIYKVA